MPPMINGRESIRIAVSDQLSKLSSSNESQKSEVEVLVEHYSVPMRPLLWVDENGVTDRAKSVIKEIAKADEYGLRTTDYELPEPDGFDRRRRRRCGLARRRRNQNRFSCSPLRARLRLAAESILHA